MLAENVVAPAMPKAPPPVLLRRAVVEVEDELDRSWRQNFAVVKSFLESAGDGDISERLQEKVAKLSDHATMCGGLLYGMLTEAEVAPRYFQHLQLITRDNFQHTCSLLCKLTAEKFSRLMNVPRRQLLWLVGELIVMDVADVDHVCVQLLRQVLGGDVSPENVWLADTMLTLVRTHMQWVCSRPHLLQLNLVTFLRVLADHHKADLAELRAREVSFCVQALRSHVMECVEIGRDLVRLLQDVVKLPEIAQLWNTIQSNPTSLDPDFHGIPHLLATRTPRRFLLSRVSPDMEAKLVFIMSQVKMGSQRRHQLWFQQRYITSPAAETLWVDIIRFICGVYHPSNQIINSDKTQRWAVIGWVLRSIKSHTVAANAKLALFYDYLFFNHKVDSIMNIEPAILLIVHSLQHQPELSSTLLEFLFMAMAKYSPPMAKAVHKSVHNALHAIISKRVVPSLDVLYKHPVLSKGLRTQMAKMFPTLNRAPGDPVATQQQHQHQQQQQHQQQHVAVPAVGDAGPSSPGSSPTGGRTAAAGGTAAGGGDEEMGGGGVRLSPTLSGMAAPPGGSGRASPSAMDLRGGGGGGGGDEGSSVVQGDHSASAMGAPVNGEPEALVVPPMLAKWEADIRKVAVRVNSDPAQATDALTRLVRSFLEQQGNVPDAVDAMGRVLAAVLQRDMEIANLSPAKLASKRGTVVHRALFGVLKLDQAVSLNLLHSIAKHAPSVRVAFCVWLLWSLKLQEDKQLAAASLSDWAHSSSVSAPKPVHVGGRWLAPYLALLKLGAEGVMATFFDDLHLCLASNSDLFFRMVPKLLGHAGDLAHGSPRFIRLVVASVDPANLHWLVNEAQLGHMSVVSFEQLLPLLKQSLLFSAFEQDALWKLLVAQFGAEANSVLEALPSLLPLYAAEAADELNASLCTGVAGLGRLLRLALPTADAVDVLMAQPESLGAMVCDVLVHWMIVASGNTRTHVAASLQKALGRGTGEPGVADATRRIHHLTRLRDCKRVMPVRDLFASKAVKEAIRALYDAGMVRAPPPAVSGDKRRRESMERNAGQSAMKKRKRA